MPDIPKNFAFGQPVGGIVQFAYTVADIEQYFAGVTADSQISNRLENTARFGVTALREHSVNPTPTGQPFDPFGFGPNYLGNVVTVTGANGDSVTGQAILDFGGTYPVPLPSNPRQINGKRL